MKIIRSLGKHHYKTVISIFLITLALVVCMPGCYTPLKVQYQLTISSTTGGSVIYPGEGTFVYNAGEVVNLVAIAEGGYYFIDWGGDVATIIEPHSASTIITMNDHYFIRARFLQGQPIWDWWDLYEIRQSVGGRYLLMNNLNSTTYGYDELASETANNGTGWQPIGTDIYPFTGTFDGQGYEIRELFIDRPEEDYVGLFGFFGEGGIIENFGVVNATVTGNYSVGGLVGYLPCGCPDAVSNSYFSGIVSGYLCVGGIVGNGGGDVRNCYSSGNVSGYDYVGGLVGASLCLSSPPYKVSECYSTANVTGNGYHIGGLEGYQNWAYGVGECFWDTETSGQPTSDGGTGKNTTEMKDITTFSSAGWNITAVANPDMRNTSYIWNIVNNMTYPFLSWEP